MIKVIYIEFYNIYYIILSFCASLRKFLNFEELIFIELCCLYCNLKNIHYSHNLIEINDSESLSKQNLIIEETSKQFNEIFEKILNLKEKIEKEISSIDELYEKRNKDIADSFLKKHEKLIMEENDLKENLKTEVTKVKEKLENFLSESNNIIKINEKINKGIKNLEKEEKNIIKTLSYISKMNKNKKQMNNLLQNLMRNINISFQQKASNIKYEEYFFNGIQIPKNIEFKDISSTNFKIVWNIDDLNILNFKKDDVKFRVELRKENTKEKFIQVYKGNATEFIAQNLNKNTNYEIRICSFYNDLFSNWSEIKKIKTNDLDSVILRESKNEVKFLDIIYKWIEYKRMELLYRGSRDGSTSKIFHEKCDNKGPTLCLYRNEKGYIFGGYASISWSSDNNVHEAKNSFIFTLTNIYGTEPTKFPNKDNKNVYHHPNKGPTFGANNDIRVFKDYLNEDCRFDFPINYNDILNRGKSIFTWDLNNNNNEAKVNEIEVFRIYN